MAVQKKKKVDRAALSSSFMRIPRMKVEVARSLIDAGVSEIFQLEGRSPETLFAELKKKRDDVPDEHLAYFRMAVYFAENQPPDRKMMHPSCWMD
ncbi:helix-hairpin-helix domain-containing protein [Rubellicoccus peritrichatus]|uniref:Helix-hairpin-helix domain-containing protein n=1 Tax=Rubellicoccus peritrichatus TaxID=3080537 RepID=A0AAQ3QR61_9BACT|nr:helix-hairpin-helix domain-containing protein [Puniceicoccus sp. CR14]WOO40988.1 helix-hairpin-helix domain-containing protein [Puniceicoccus sp. CR14]